MAVAEAFVKQIDNDVLTRGLYLTGEEYPGAWQLCGLSEMYYKSRPADITWYGRHSSPFRPALPDLMFIEQKHHGY